MKKTAFILFAAMLMAALSACGAGNITLQNDTGAVIEELYVSLSDAEEWGNVLNKDTIAVGAGVSVNVAKLGDAEARYDIAMLDEDEFVYEIYELMLKNGDAVAISVDDDGYTAIATVTHADGSTEEYYGEVYDYNEDYYDYDADYEE